MMKKQNNRPLSPHLHTYASQITSVISIFHRITGSILALSLIILPVVATLFYSFVSYHIVYSILVWVPVFFNVICSLFLITITFHCMNGFRHMLWDLCIGLELHNVVASGLLVLSITGLSYSFIIFIL